MFISGIMKRIWPRLIMFWNQGMDLLQNMISLGQMRFIIPDLNINI